MNKVCPKCHTRNRDDAFICTKCGYRIMIVEHRNSTPRSCPAGKHPMDPDWQACPYCGDPETPTPDAARRVDNLLFIDDEATKSHEQPQHAQRQSTRFEAGTLAVANQPLIQRSNQQAPGRRMVGVIVTYSWLPQGQVFPVFEGRNYLGKDPECEVRLVTDHSLSGKHAAIFYRGRYFTITDEKSMNGTYVNGAEAPITGMPLSNYDEIKTGATTWRFIIIEPQVALSEK